MAHVAGLPQATGKNYTEFPAFDWPNAGQCGHLKSEPMDETILVSLAVFVPLLETKTKRSGFLTLAE